MTAAVCILADFHIHFGFILSQHRLGTVGGPAKSEREDVEFQTEKLAVILGHTEIEESDR